MFRFVYFKVSGHSFLLLNNDARRDLLESSFWKRVHNRVTKTQVRSLKIKTLFQARFLTHDRIVHFVLKSFHLRDRIITLAVSRTVQGIVILGDIMSSGLTPKSETLFLSLTQLSYCRLL